MDCAEQHSSELQRNFCYILNNISSSRVEALKDILVEESVLDGDQIDQINQTKTVSSRIEKILLLVIRKNATDIFVKALGKCGLEFIPKEIGTLFDAILTIIGKFILLTK
jgi:Caspase recruitment domain